MAQTDGLTPVAEADGHEAASEHVQDGPVPITHIMTSVGVITLSHITGYLVTGQTKKLVTMLS